MLYMADFRPLTAFHENESQKTLRFWHKKASLQHTWKLVEMTTKYCRCITWNISLCMGERGKLSQRVRWTTPLNSKINAFLFASTILLLHWQQAILLTTNVMITEALYRYKRFDKNWWNSENLPKCELRGLSATTTKKHVHLCNFVLVIFVDWYGYGYDEPPPWIRKLMHFHLQAHHYCFINFNWQQAFFFTTNVMVNEAEIQAFQMMKFVK